ncbi:hypothetical protein [Halorussus salinisoli]|uniref:hypothetical protein n=1 Tax=Halorussus salinisoli TaxID=2558242 RepID=UPI0010C1792F|nr:hypothetical protein [Halorussus salinisoli]
MVPRSPVLDPYTGSESRLVVALTTAILFLGGLVTAYRAVLRDAISTLSSVEWVVFTVGPFLVEPILLFGVLYYVGSRRDVTVSLVGLLPGLVVAVAVGTLLGQYLGVRLWESSAFLNEVPVVQAWGKLFIPDPRVLAYWRILVEPLARDFLTAVAALALARTTDTE